MDRQKGYLRWYNVAERNSLFWREPKVVGLLNIRKQITEIFELAFVKPGSRNLFV